MDSDSLQYREAVKAMAANGMSQREIAASLSISQPTVSRLLKSIDEPEPQDENALQFLERLMREKDERLVAAGMLHKAVLNRWKK